MYGTNDITGELRALEGSEIDIVSGGSLFGAVVGAAVGFVVAIGNTIALFALTKGNVTPWMLAMTVVFVIAYWNALRGTIAEHRLSGSPPIGAKVKSA